MLGRISHRLAILAAGGVLAILSVAAYAAGVQLPVITKGKGDQCVEPTEVIRRDHMDFLLHQRDDTVIRGVRTKQHSLSECIDCHVAKDDAGNYIPIDSEGQFCESCHRYAAVEMDCFQCQAWQQPFR